MFKQVLTQFPYLNLVLVGQLMFFAIFVGALFWVFRPGSKECYRRLSAMPLEAEGATGAQGANDE